MLACGEQIRPVSMMASSVKQESRGFSHVRFKEENNIKSGSNETFLKHLKLYEVPISLFIRRAKFL